MSLLLALQQKKNLTATEAMIADYILQNPEAFAHLSITELAKATYSSKAAITRMCQKLGQDGYKNFRTAFAVEMEKQRYERRDIDINYPFVPRESAASIMRSVNYISKEALDACYAALSPEAIDRAARTLRNANHIYLYGAGDTYISAIAFSNMLMKLGIQAVLDLQRFAIGGGISVRPEVTNIIRETLDELFALFPATPFAKPEIETCRYGNDANLIGALRFHLEAN